MLSPSARRTRGQVGLALAAAVFATIALPGTALAITLTPAGWTRGSTANSTYYGWNIFNSVTGPNTPDVGQFPASGNPTYSGAPSPNAYNAAPNAASSSFVTSGGNIYSPTAVVNGRVDLPGYNTGTSSITTILLQIRTQGTEPVNYTAGATEGVRLTYAGNTIYPVAQQETARVALGGFGGFQVDRAYVFNVPTDPSAYSILFDAAGSSMSLDQIRVDSLVSPLSSGYADTGVVPEPTSIGALALTTMGLLARRKRSER